MSVDVRSHVPPVFVCTHPQQRLHVCLVRTRTHCTEIRLKPFRRPYSFISHHSSDIHVTFSTTRSQSSIPQYSGRHNALDMVKVRRVELFNAMEARAHSNNHSSSRSVQPHVWLAVCSTHMFGSRTPLWACPHMRDKNGRDRACAV